MNGWVAGGLYPSSNGTSIVFTVPNTIVSHGNCSGNMFSSQNSCTLVPTTVAMGDYQLTVVTASGASNGIKLSVIAPRQTSLSALNSQATLPLTVPATNSLPGSNGSAVIPSAVVSSQVQAGSAGATSGGGLISAPNTTPAVSTPAPVITSSSLPNSNSSTVISSSVVSLQTQTGSAPATSGGGLISSPNTTIPTVSTPATVIPKPSTPAKPIVEKDSTCGGRVNVSWTAVPGATSYNIFRATTQNAGFGRGTTITAYSKVISGVLGTYHTDTPGHGTYYYKVMAVNSTGDSSQSPASSAITGSAACRVSSNDSTQSASAYDAIQNILNQLYQTISSLK